MKHTILQFAGCFVLIALLLYTSGSAAQIQQHSHIYRAGDCLIKQQVAYKDPGASGRELTWDFFKLDALNDAYSLSYFIPDSTDMTRLCGMEHRTRYYYRMCEDTVWIEGYENNTTFVQYAQAVPHLRFPMAYGDTLAGEFRGEGEYSRRFEVKVHGNVCTVVDAEGELRLPDGVVRGALRTHTAQRYVQTMPDTNHIQLDTYKWYARGVRYPVFESVVARTVAARYEDEKVLFETSFYYPPEQQLNDTDEVQEVDSAMMANPLGAIEQVFTEARYLPNPVVSDLQISYKLTRQAQVWFRLCNAIGVVQRQTSPQMQTDGWQQHTINMGGLMTGAYTLYVHVDDMVVQSVIVKR